MQRTSIPLGWLTATAMVLSSGLASSERERERPLLLGGPLPDKQREIRLDPRLPRGAAKQFSHRPERHPERSLCSFRRPVCVHGAPGAEASVLTSALGAMETAYERVVIALGAPAPPPDAGRGGSDALDLYLLEGAEPLEVGLDAHRYARWDRGSSFCKSAARGPAALARAATQCVGEAIGRDLDAGTTPHALRAFATHLWWATGNPTALDAEAVDNLQARPEAAPMRRERGELSEGAAVFFELLEQSQGRGQPTALSRGLLTLAASSTEPASPTWNNEPDVFDVLRRTLDDDPHRMAELGNDWAVSRAFVGSRDDGTRAPALGFSGDFGRVRFDWMMRYSELPRRVAATRPIEPMGSIYVSVDLDDVGLGDTLGFQAQWEAPVSFVWSLVQVDRQGREMRRLEVPFKERATMTEQRLQDFEGAAHLLVVGTNLGGVDRDHPFDPDVFPYEPHQCTVYLVKL